MQTMITKFNLKTTAKIKKTKKYSKATKYNRKSTAKLRNITRKAQQSYEI